MSVSLEILGNRSPRCGGAHRASRRDLDSIAADSAAVPLTTPQRDELDRRLADHASHPNDVVSWEEVKASLDERLKK